MVQQPEPLRGTDFSLQISEDKRPDTGFVGSAAQSLVFPLSSAKSVRRSSGLQRDVSKNALSQIVACSSGYD